MSEESRESRLDYTLTCLVLWIEGRLQHLEHRGYSDRSGHPHGGAVAYIPEWELRQKLDEIRAVKLKFFHHDELPRFQQF